MANLNVTPNPAREGQSLVITADGIGNPVAASLATNLTGTNNDLVFTAVDPGAAGNSITMTYAVAGNNTPLSVSVASTDITVHVATDGGGVGTSTANQVMAAVIASGAAASLVSTALKATNDGTGVVIALAKTNLTGGVDTTATAVVIQILDSDLDDALSETVTLGLDGKVTSVGDFSWEVGEAGTYTVKLIVDSVVTNTVSVRVFSE